MGKTDTTEYTLAKVLVVEFILAKKLVVLPMILILEYQGCRREVLMGIIEEK